MYLRFYAGGNKRERVNRVDIATDLWKPGGSPASVCSIFFENGDHEQRPLDPQFHDRRSRAAFLLWWLAYGIHMRMVFEELS
jgi:hypothetical protein